MKLFYFIIITFLFSCNQKQINSEPQIIPPVKNDTNDIKRKVFEIKRDTIYKDYSNTDYSNRIYFGMTVKEWNKALARSTQDSLFDKIGGGGAGLGQYFAMKTSSKVHSTFSGVFHRPISEGYDKVEIFRVKNITQFEPILYEIKIEQQISDPDIYNDLLQGYISHHRLSFVTGDKILLAQIDPIQTSDFSNAAGYLDSLVNPENFRKRKRELANTENYRRSSNNRKTSLLENETTYTILEIEETKTFLVKRNYLGDIYEIDHISSHYSLTINPRFKGFSDIKVLDFETPSQKEKRESKQKVDSLINKALND